MGATVDGLGSTVSGETVAAVRSLPDMFKTLFQSSCLIGSPQGMGRKVQDCAGCHGRSKESGRFSSRFPDREQTGCHWRRLWAASVGRRLRRQNDGFSNVIFGLIRGQCNPLCRRCLTLHWRPRAAASGTRKRLFRSVVQTIPRATPPMC